MKKHVRPAIFILFVLQMGFLLYEQRASSDIRLKIMDSEIKLLTDAGLPLNQASAVVSAISSAEGHATSSLWNVGFIVSFVSFLMIIVVTNGGEAEKSQI